MRGKRVILYLLAAGLLGAVIYLLLPDLDRTREEAADGQDEAVEGDERAVGGGSAVPPRVGQDPGAQSTAVQGLVKDGDTGKPVAEVEVSLRGPGDRASGVSGADGRFELEVGSGGAYRVELSSETHVAEGPAPLLRVEAGTPIKGLVLEVHRLATVAGQVVDGRVSPVAGAKVRVARAGGQQQFAVLDAVARSDSSGRFTLKVPSGEVVLRAETDELGAALSPPLYVRPGAHLQGVTIRLGSGASLTGKVVGPGRRLVKGAQVALRDELGTRKVPCDAQGNFAVGGLSQGGKLLQAMAAGFSPSHVSRILIDKEQPQHVVLVLRAAKGIGGQVIGLDGSPVGGVRVTVRPGTPRGPMTTLLPPLEGRTSPAGQFSFKDVPATPLVVTARSDHGTASRAGVPPGTYDIVLRLSRTGGITGQATDGARGQPVRDLTVSVTRVEGTGDPYGPRPTTRFVSTDGRFTIDGLLPGTYGLTFAARGYGAETMQGIGVTADHYSRIKVVFNAGGAVAGVVVDRRGVGLPGASVRVDTGWHGRPASSDAQGRFRVEDVARGRRSLTASHPGYDTRIVSGVSVLPRETTEVRVELSPRRGKHAGLKLSGIGAVLAHRGGLLTVLKALPGSPAAAAGLRAGDRITTVDGKKIDSFGEGIEAIRGIVGTPVRLQLLRGKTSITVDVIRDDVSVPDKS
jgi:hypothetical protein